MNEKGTVTPNIQSVSKYESIDREINKGFFVDRVHPEDLIGDRLNVFSISLNYRIDSEGENFETTELQETNSETISTKKIDPKKIDFEQIREDLYQEVSKSISVMQNLDPYLEI